MEGWQNATRDMPSPARFASPSGSADQVRSLLGIDLGTTGLKAVIFDLSGRPLGQGFAPNQYLPAAQGRAEQDPRDWWAGCCRAIQAALAKSGVNAGDIAGIGVCGFHHCPVFLNAEGEPSRPTIVTHDPRLGGSLAALEQSGVLAAMVQLSGSRVMTGHFPPIYHLVQTHDRRALEETRWLLLAKDFLRYRLTGEIGTEICDATGTHLVAMPGEDWSDTLCELLQVPQEKLPKIGRPTQVAGHVTSEAAEATGLKPGTPVVYGGGDSHCALVGLGITGSGEVGMLLGTNSTLRASFKGSINPGPHMVWSQQHVVPGRFTVSASSMAGSSVLTWFKDLGLVDRQEGAVTYRDLEALAASVPPGSGGLLFHPYLHGERSPFYNPGAGGAFLAIRHWHGKGHFVRSIMEGIAFSIANCFDAIQAIAQERGESLTTVRTGESGGSRLPIWRQIIADALDHSLQLVCVDEPGCLGAALLAGVGVGVYEDIPSAVDQTVRLGTQTSPDPERAALYQKRRALFNETYKALEPFLYQPIDHREVG